MKQFKEIGSEFWNVECTTKDNELFPPDTMWFMSGRSALRFCIENIKERHEVKTAELPSWCCDSIILPFIEAGIEVNFYSVSFNQSGLTISPTFDCDIVFLMDFFGYDCGTEFLQPKGNTAIVIRDMTHSLFNKRYQDADYYFGSLRKWSGIWTGGYAWSKHIWQKEKNVLQLSSEYVNLRKHAMSEKELYVLGKNPNKTYLSLFSQAEGVLDTDSTVRESCERDISASRKLDWKRIKRKRQENAGYLLEKLNLDFIFPSIQDNDCPMFVPVFIDNRDEFRKYMIKNRIYLPVHWPLSKFHSLDRDFRELYNNTISLVCDQRYGIADMQRIVSFVEQWNKQVKFKI